MSKSERYANFLSGREHLVDSTSYPLREIVAEIPCRVKPGKALAKVGMKRKRVDRLLARKQTLSADLVETVAALLRDLELYTFEADDSARVRILEAAERLYPSQEPAEVHVELLGPDWLDVGHWLPKSRRVKARQARWLLQNLDGLSVGGATLNVHCEPPIRRGRIPPRREPESQRKRRLFSRWFDGIRVDEEGLFSLTPEALALDMTSGLSGTVVDGTCGVGALAIAAARQPGVTHVSAVDCRRARLDMARHNAALYDVAHRLEFIEARLERWISGQVADWLLLDPPWGGPGYDRKALGMSDLPFPLEGVIASFDGGIRIKLPRSFCVSELGDGWRFRPAVDDRGILKFLIAERGPVA